ncbi:MAG: TolC family protein [Deltaproteobacteria bacterium]|nr:TolC family protein [Deltaproteobacteria bacterium]
MKINFHQFIDRVEQNHPEKHIDDLSLQRAGTAENKAGVLMDPEVSVGREAVPLPFLNPMQPDANEARWKVGVTQIFPWPGTLDAERKSARASTFTIDLSTRLAAIQRKLEAEEFFISLVLTAKLIEIERGNLNETINILKSAEIRLKNGIGSHLDVIQSYNEKMILSLNLAAQENDLQNIKDRAGQLIGKEDARNVSFELDLPAEYRDTSLHVPTLGEQRPDDIVRQRLQAAQDAISSDLTVERKKSLPNIMTSAMLMQDDSGMRMYEFMLGIRVPLYSGGIRQAVERETLLVASRLSDELSWHDRRKRLAQSQNDRRRSIVITQLKGLDEMIIPNASQHLKTSLIEYAQGKGSFLAVNTARKLLLRYQQAYALAERNLAFTAVSRERIEAGLFATELDQDTPKLPIATDMSGGTEMGSQAMGDMAPTPGSSRSMKKDIETDNKAMRKGLMPSEQEDEAAKKKGSMGM